MHKGRGHPDGQNSKGVVRAFHAFALRDTHGILFGWRNDRTRADIDQACMFILPRAVLVHGEPIGRWG